MSIYLIVILVILIGEYLLGLGVETLNLRHASPVLPKEFEGSYDAEKYRKSQEYLKETTKFRLIKGTFFTAVIITFILIGGFNYVDQFARSVSSGYILSGLIFAGILMLGFQIFNIPFAAYSTFVIEGKFGFNRTTAKTFILDIIKGLLLGAVIGGAVFSFVMWLFAAAGKGAWVYCWIGVSLLQLFLVFIGPVVIMPLFNKFIPLEDGELKRAIEGYARSQDFQLKGIFKMDASRRSSKSNAFFTGFGKYRRIALFDNLIQRHTVDELVSILAHEIGHYKNRHIFKIMGLSVATTGLMFLIMSFFIGNEGLFSAFRMRDISVYAGLFFFGFLYTPINLLFSVLGNFLSRRYEYQADEFAARTYKRPQDMITALKKLTVDNLSNLTPHPLKVFLDYSHPPVLKRIEAIRSNFSGLFSQ
ncbi:MAG: M48 family metallopeptidase [Candidatus Omnitrophica bacterium]|nr:M48 family metallopeptidase [Candidatus Omnitrophota bacterium]